MELKIKVENTDDINTRLDKFIFLELEKEDNFAGFYSRTKIQDLIQKNLIVKDNSILVNNSYKVQLNDEFTIKLNNDFELSLLPTNIPLNIVYEDEELLVINKQAGLTTHPGAGNYNNTLVNGLLFYCQNNLSTLNGLLRPGIVHRLDKDTSGLMVVAKNDFAHTKLAEQLLTRELKRNYIAIIWGTMFPLNGKIDGFINRCKANRLKMEMVKNGGKYSLTNYNTLHKFKDLASIVECKLDTGRTHQIRVHFSSKKHPLIGDPLYCNFYKELEYEDQERANYINNFPRQALHSKSIKFIHPKTNEIMHFDTELPDDMKELINSFDLITAL